MNKKVIVLVGSTLSGKTTFRRKTYKELAAKGVKVGYINRDEIRFACFGKYYKHNDRDERFVTEQVQKQAQLMSELAYEVVIIDSTNLRQKYINQTLKYFSSDYEVEYVHFNVPLWKLHLRNVKRLFTEWRWIPLHVIRKMKQDYDTFVKNKT